MSCCFCSSGCGFFGRLRLVVLFVFVPWLVLPVPADAQPRAEQLEPSALAAAAARLGRVIWTPVVRLDRVGIDPFVLRSVRCPSSRSVCLPVYRPDFVLGGHAGADVWMALSERFLVQTRGRAVGDWYRRYADQRTVVPDVSQAVRYVGARLHLDFGWRHATSRRGMLTEVAHRIGRTATDRRMTAALRLGRFAFEGEWGAQRLRYERPVVAHPSFRYAWFDADVGRLAARLRPAVAGPSRWSVSLERLASDAPHRPSVSAASR